MNGIMRDLKNVLKKENLNKNSFDAIYFLISKNNIEFSLEFSDIDGKDIENISIVKNLMIKNSYLIADKFYNHLLKFEVIKKIILKEPSLLSKLKQSLSKYIKEFFSLNYDEDYFFSRLQIGFAHFNNGISLDIYIKSYAYLLSLFMEIIKKEMPELRIDAIFSKFFNFNKLLRKFNLSALKFRQTKRRDDFMFPATLRNYVM